jgi:hypothetical protein
VPGDKIKGGYKMTIYKEIENMETQGPALEEIPAPEVQEQAPGLKFKIPNLDILKAETGKGDIEDYISHPLNLKKNKGIAQILRGLTGLLGNLNLAIVDILLGMINTKRGVELDDTIQ